MGQRRLPRIAVLLILLLVTVTAGFVLISLQNETIVVTVDATQLTAGAENDRNNRLLRLPGHRAEVTIAGTASPTSTVTITVNDVVEGTQYVPADRSDFRFEHIPMPSAQIAVLRVDATEWHVIHLIRAEPLVAAILNPEPLTSPVTLDIIRSDLSGNVVARGTGPPSSVFVFYDSTWDPAKKSFPPAQERARIRIDPNGLFDAPIALAAGMHRIWGAASDCDVLACASEAEIVNVDRSVPPPDEFRPERSMTLKIGYKQLAVDVTAVLSRQDVIAQRIVEGQHGDAIVAAIYGSTLINDSPVFTLFTDTVPTYRLTESTIEVSVKSERQRPADTTLPTIGGRVVIVNSPERGSSRSWKRDTVSVKLSEYALAKPQPLPDRTQPDGSLSWDQPFSAEGGRVSMALSFVPWSSVDALRAFLSLSVFAFVPHVIARYLAFFGGLTFAIPMLIYLAMTRHRRKARLRAAARLLTAICVAPDVFLALSTSQPHVNSVVSGIFPSWSAITVVDLISPLLCACLLSVAAATVAVFPWRNRDTFWMEVGRESALAVTLASGLFVLAAFATFAVHGQFRMNAAQGAVYLAAMTVLIASVGTAALATCGFYKNDEGRIAWSFIALAAIVALITATPVAFTRYVIWAASPALNATVLGDSGAPMGLILDYFRQAGVLCNFSFGLGLVATAFLSNGGNGLNRPQLLRLTLCSYAVASTVSIFMIPVSFLLAWVTFRSVLYRKRVSGLTVLEIRTNRAKAVTDLLLWPKTEDLTVKMQDLTGKFVDGDVTEEEYDTRRKRLQELLDKQMPPAVAYAFGVGPKSTSRANGTVGLRVAAAFVIGHVLLFLATETATLRVAHSAYTLLVIVAYLATGIAQFLVPAFVFGACFDLIRGASGLQKGITVAAWAIGCSLPSWLVSLPSAISVVSLVVETALFYTVLGFVFDAVILRESRSIPFRIWDVPKLAGVPALSWAGTVAVAALGVTISGVLSGQFQNVATSTITSVYRQATLGP